MAWNRSSGEVTSSASQRGRRLIVSNRRRFRHSIRCVLAGLIVVSGLGVAVWILSGPSELRGPSEPSRRSSFIKDATPAASSESRNVAKEPARVISPEEQRKLRPGDPGFDPAAHPTVLVLSTNTIDAILKTDEHPVARNATEQMLGWIFSTQVGDMPPICPNLPFSEVADIEKILDLPADYQYDESLEKLEAKKTIEFAKKELKDYIAKGGTPQKFFEYYHGQLMQCYQEFTMAQGEVLRVAREEDPGFARDYLCQVNKRLADKGIKQIRLSPKMRKRLGITEETNAKEIEE